MAATSNKAKAVNAWIRGCFCDMETRLLPVRNNHAPSENIKKAFDENPANGNHRSTTYSIPAIIMNDFFKCRISHQITGVNSKTTNKSLKNHVGPFMGEPVLTAYPNRLMTSGLISPYRHRSQRSLIQPRSLNPSIKLGKGTPFITCPANRVIQ